jgi:kumamolisin
MAQIPPGYRAVSGTERTPVPGARRVGPADPHEVLSVSLRLRRRTDAPPLPTLEDFCAGLGTRPRVSRSEFAAKFGASDDDLNRIADFARANSLSVVESSAARRTVVLCGKVSQMERAFGVELGTYESPTGTYRGREGAVHLPAEIAGLVEGVFGLDNRRMATRGAGGSSGAGLITPRQAAELYNFPLAANAAGQTIAILEFGGGFRVNSHGVAVDIQAYFDSQGLATPNLFPVPVDGVKNSPGHSDDIEVVLDIEVAGAVAEGANLAVYFAHPTEFGWTQSVSMAVHGDGLPAGLPLPSVLSISWGGAERAWTAAAISTMSQTFQEAALLGVTVLAASGDNGSDCHVHDHKAHVNYPQSDPGVTTCGGTSIQNVNGSNFTEATWNRKHATGGGISDVFPLPEFQAFAGVPGSVNDGHSGRGIPDIAGHADGYAILINGSTEGLVGTSETAPLYAGLIALINAVIGDSVGYLNPILYQLATTKVFRDIADGGSNAYAGAPGYTSGPGWDCCTGWGSVDGTALLDEIETVLFAMIVPALD